MTPNVRCAGGGLWVKAVGFEEAASGVLYMNGPCGWEGTRQVRVELATGTRSIRRRLPCPRCGGQVELMSQEQPA